MGQHAVVIRDPDRHRPAFGHRQGPAFGMPSTNTASPSGKWSWKLPPAATATNCSPSTENTDGAALTPAPHWNCHSTLPVLASYALNQPLPSPVKTRPPAVAVAPPIMGCSVFTCHTFFPVARSIAVTLDRKAHV